LTELTDATNHKAVGVQAVAAGTRRDNGGLGDTEAGVKKWMMVLGAALKNKNPPAVTIPAQGGQPSARIELHVAEYDTVTADGERAERARRARNAVVTTVSQLDACTVDSTASSLRRAAVGSTRAQSG
jgi:hypothetical protein